MDIERRIVSKYRAIRQERDMERRMRRLWGTLWLLVGACVLALVASEVLR